MTTEPKHRRLSFMDGLVLAIAAGEKTVTRRMIKTENAPDPGFVWRPCVCREIDPADTPCMSCVARFDEPRFLPGDILDVCEALVPIETMVAGGSWWATCYRPTRTVVSRGEAIDEWSWKVRVLPARYCPTWAVRHHRRILDVRPERLSAVTDAEAVREGVARLGWAPTREGFLRGFRELHGLEADSDPWVWRIEFSKEQA